MIFHENADQSTCAANNRQPPPLCYHLGSIVVKDFRRQPSFPLLLTNAVFWIRNCNAQRDSWHIWNNELGKNESF